VDIDFNDMDFNKIIKEYNKNVVLTTEYKNETEA
jgi:hypothetical protein